SCHSEARRIRRGQYASRALTSRDRGQYPEYFGLSAALLRTDPSRLRMTGARALRSRLWRRLQPPRRKAAPDAREVAVFPGNQDLARDEDRAVRAGDDAEQQRKEQHVDAPSSQQQQR